MQRKFLICLVLMVMISLCCGMAASATAGDPPVAGFTLSYINANIPVTVTMTDTSTGNPDTWEWTVDNYPYKTGQGPHTITFTKAGTYQIGLFVTNQFGSNFKEIPFVINSAASPSTACVITATPDKTTLDWGETVIFTGTAYGCLGTVKIPVIVRVRGPNLPGTGLDLTRDLDYVTSPPDTNEAFPIIWYTGNVRLHNNVDTGVYTVTFVDGNGAEYNPIKLDFSKQPLCSLKATADKTQYFWIEKVQITGNAIDCPGGVKVKLGSVPNGPEIPGVVHYPIGSKIPEGVDLTTGQPGADSSFSFTLDLASLQQQYSLQDGPYIFYVLNAGQDQYVKIPVHLGILGSPTCSISINNAGNYENYWGDKLTFSGIEEKCPFGVQFRLVRDTTLPMPGIEIGSANAGSNSWYTWTWDSGQTQQKYSLPDGVYSVYATNFSGEPLYTSVYVKMATAGNPPSQKCFHHIYAYETTGVGMPKSVGGIDVQIYGSNSVDTYNIADVIDTTITSTDGPAVLYIPGSDLAKWQYFHTSHGQVPAGYHPDVSTIVFPKSSGNQLAFKRQDVCTGSTQIWFEPTDSSATDCIREITVYDGKSGDRHKRGPAGTVIKAFGSPYNNAFSHSDLVSTSLTGADGAAVMYFPESVTTGQYKYVHITIELPTGYILDGVRQGDGQMDTLAVESAHACRTFTEFWIIPLPARPQGTVTPQKTIETPIPGGTQAPGRDAGEQTPSILNYIFSLPQTIMSLVQGSPAPGTQTTGSDSVVNIPQGSSNEAQEGSMHVVVLPSQAEQHMDTIQGSGKAIPANPDFIQPPPDIIRQQSQNTQEYMNAGPESNPNVTPSSEPRISIPDTYIGNGPQLANVRLPCPTGYATCNGQCVNLMTDSANCGSCYMPCTPGFICSSGACIPQCNAGQNICKGTCVNVQTDPNNCGTCGNVCPSGGTCNYGQCPLKMAITQPTRLGAIGTIRPHI